MIQKLGQETYFWLNVCNFWILYHVYISPSHCFFSRREEVKKKAVTRALELCNLNLWPSLQHQSSYLRRGLVQNENSQLLTEKPVQSFPPHSPKSFFWLAIVFSICCVMQLRSSQVSCVSPTPGPDTLHPGPSSTHTHRVSLENFSGALVSSSAKWRFKNKNTKLLTFLWSFSEILCVKCLAYYLIPCHKSLHVEYNYSIIGWLV